MAHKDKPTISTNHHFREVKASIYSTDQPRGSKIFRMMLKSEFSRSIIPHLHSYTCRDLMLPEN